jgi:hypothetical protein
LLAHPEEALAAIDALFALTGDAASRARTAERVFSRHAKFGGKFNREDRIAGQRSAAEVHAEEIDKVIAWAEAVASNAGVALDLPSPLLGS